MSRVLDPFRFVLIAFAGWMNQRQLQIIDYIRQENCVLREQLGGRRVRLNGFPGRTPEDHYPRPPASWENEKRRTFYANHGESPRLPIPKE
jgi:hypothetical protein